MDRLVLRIRRVFVAVLISRDLIVSIFLGDSREKEESRREQRIARHRKTQMWFRGLFIANNSSSNISQSKPEYYEQFIGSILSPRTPEQEPVL